MSQVYFLKAGMVSLVIPSEQSIDVEVGIVGFEGVAGGGETLSGFPAVTEAMIQIAGSGWKLPSAIFQEDFCRGGTLQ